MTLQVLENVCLVLRGIANTMGDLKVVRGIKKLNSNNYNTWATCMTFYLQRQDIREIIDGSKIMPLEEDASGALRRRRIEVGKAMFVLKTTIKEEMLTHYFHRVKSICCEIIELNLESSL